MTNYNQPPVVLLNRRTINTALFLLAVLHCCVWAFAFTESREFFAAETANLGSGVGPSYAQAVIGGASYLQTLDRTYNNVRSLHYAQRAQQVLQQSLDRTNHPPISCPQSVNTGSSGIVHTFSPQPSSSVTSSEPAASATTEGAFILA